MIDISKILSKLNLTKYKPIKEVPLHHSNKPETLFTGLYGGNLIIVHPDLPFQFFHDKRQIPEKLFLTHFLKVRLLHLLRTVQSDSSVMQ